MFDCASLVYVKLSLCLITFGLGRKYAMRMGFLSVCVSHSVLYCKCTFCLHQFYPFVV